MDAISEKVIRCLLETEGYVTTASLADMTGISISSIKHNLNWIREELEKFNIQLQSTPKKGFCLTATTEERMKAFQKLEEEASRHKDSFIFRKGYILETLFDFKANYTISLFSEELAVSRNTIQKDLDQIKEQLAHLDVDIRRVRNQGVVLTGAEFNIRQAIIEHNNSKYWNWNPDTILEVADGFDLRVSKKAYTYLSGTYSEMNLLAIQKLLCEAEKLLGITLVDISFCRMIEYLAIMRQRILNLNIIVKTGSEENLPEIDKRFLNTGEGIVKKLVPKFAKSLHMEALYLAACLYANHTCENFGSEISHDYGKIAEDYLCSLEPVLEMKGLKRDEELVSELGVFFHQVKIREAYQILVWDELHRDIQKQLSGLYAACMANLFMVEERINTMFRQDDIAWVALLIHNFMTDAKNKTKVVFLHATDKHTALYQKRKIERKIPQIRVTECIYYGEYKMIQGEDTLIVSTVPTEKKQKNIIEVTKHIYDSDIELIRGELEKLEEQKKGMMIKKLVSDVFEKELMICELNARTKEDAIMQMSQILLERGYVKQEFCDQVLARENFCPTSIGKEIAIPHHYGDYIIKSKTAVARLKHRISWQKTEKVSLVFLIANNFEDPEKLQMLFKYLYDIIEDAGQIRKVKESKSEEEMLQNILILS
jgi:activator of the mannose operon (transcriptional antiterminator)